MCKAGACRVYLMEVLALQLRWILTAQHLLLPHWLVLAGLRLCSLWEGAAARAQSHQHHCHADSVIASAECVKVSGGSIRETLQTLTT